MEKIGYYIFEVILVNISGKVVIIFSIFLNLFIYEVFFVNRLILDFGNNALYLPITYFLISIPIFYLFSTKKKINYFKSNIVLRYLLAIVLIINILFIILYMQAIVANQMFENKNTVLLIILLATAAGMLSYNGFETIFHTFVLYTPIILGVVFIYIMSSHDIKDYGNILPMEFNFKNIYRSFYLLLIPFDLLLINFYKPFYKTNFNATTLVIISFFIFLYLTFSIFESISIFPPELFDNTSESLVLRYLSYKGKVLFRNQIIFFLILIMFVCTYKASLYFYSVRLLLGIKRKYSGLLPGVMALLIQFKITVYMNVNKYFTQMVIATIIVIGIYVLISKLRGLYEAQQSWYTK